MGLNWSAGLTEVGEGLDTLGAAKEKTMEMDYKTRRDANLRRFKKEDQAREERLTGEKRTYTEGRDDVKLEQSDEAAGIGESDRAGAYRSQKEEDRAADQADKLALVNAKLAAMRKSKGKELTKDEYIQEGLKELRTKWLEETELSAGAPEEGTRYPGSRDMDMWRGVLAAEYDKNKAAGSPMDSGVDDLDPFELFDD